MIGFTNGMKFNGMGFLFILPEISFETIPATPERPALKVFTVAWLFFAIHWFYGQVDTGETKLSLTHKQMGSFFFTNSANLCCTAIPSLAVAWNTIIPGYEDGKTLQEATMNPMLQKFGIHSQFLYWAIGVGTRKKQLVSPAMREYFERNNSIT
jgi:hypothetical protein